MYRLCVLYGHPHRPSDFDSYYESTHAPLARRIPGLLRYTYGKCDGEESAPAAYYSLAELDFASPAAMDAGLASVAGVAAGEDLENFASGGVTLCRLPVADWTSGDSATSAAAPTGER